LNNITQSAGFFNEFQKKKPKKANVNIFRQKNGAKPSFCQKKPAALLPKRSGFEIGFSGTGHGAS